MTNDSHLFRTAAQLEAAGFYPVQGNRWKRGDELYPAPLRGQDGHKHSTIVPPVSWSNRNPSTGPAQVTRSHAQSTPIRIGCQTIAVQWVPASECVGWTSGINWVLGSGEITGAHKCPRTFIASILGVGAGHKVPILMLRKRQIAECLTRPLISIASFCFRFVSRQKVAGPDSEPVYIVEQQLPVIAPADYDRPFGSTTARELVRDHVLRLTYTAHDLAPFARDLGYDRPALPLGRRRAPPPPRPPRRPLLPPLRPLPRRRRLHPQHLPHRPPPRRGPVRHLPHPRPHPRLHARPRRRLDA